MRDTVYTQEALEDFARSVVGRRFVWNVTVPNGRIMSARVDGECVVGTVEGDDGSVFEVKLLCSK